MLTKGGLVSGGPFGRIVNEWLDRQGTDTTIPSLSLLAVELGIDVESLRKLKNGRRPWINFDFADKIVVTCLGPFAWWLDAELQEVYQTVDLRGIDRKRPCTKACVRMAA